jgi:5-methylcytosine-specific restriction endonuclease McrA
MREVKEQYSLETILPLIGGPKVNLDGDLIKMQSLRLINFRKHGVVCVKCKLKGIYFLKERTSQNESFHLNLYAEKDGKQILMTRDHIIPISGNGSDTLKNSQTMCCFCNVKKGGVKNGKKISNNSKN